MNKQWGLCLFISILGFFSGAIASGSSQEPRWMTYLKTFKSPTGAEIYDFITAKEYASDPWWITRPQNATDVGSAFYQLREILHLFENVLSGKYARYESAKEYLAWKTFLEILKKYPGVLKNKEMVSQLLYTGLRFDLPWAILVIIMLENDPMVVNDGSEYQDPLRADLYCNRNRNTLKFLKKFLKSSDKSEFIRDLQSFAQPLLNQLAAFTLPSEKPSDKREEVRTNSSGSGEGVRNISGNSSGNNNGTGTDNRSKTVFSQLKEHQLGIGLGVAVIGAALFGMYRNKQQKHKQLDKGHDQASDAGQALWQ